MIILRLHDKNFKGPRIIKNLLPGSLIVLSHNDFETVDLFLVTFKDDKKILETSENYGYIDIQAELMRSEAINIDEVNPSIINYYDNNRTRAFKMIESTAYFESYKHVLSKLQEMSAW